MTATTRATMSSTRFSVLPTQSRPCGLPTTRGLDRVGDSAAADRRSRLRTPHTLLAVLSRGARDPEATWQPLRSPSMLSLRWVLSSRDVGLRGEPTTPRPIHWRALTSSRLSIERNGGCRTQGPCGPHRTVGKMVSNGKTPTVEWKWRHSTKGERIATAWRQPRVTIRPRAHGR